MNDNELKLLIPSKYVREHIKSNNYEFSDRQCAALMINSAHSVNLKFDYLKKLSENTLDEKLKGQLDEWLNWIVTTYERFIQNEDGKCIYDFYREGREHKSYKYYKYARHFSSWHDAYQIAMDMEWDFEFRITKSPISFSLEDEEENGQKYISFDFFGNGEVKNIWNSENPSPDVIRNERSDPWFAEEFVDVPYPFERGDIVRDKQSGRFGVVVTSQADWKATCQKDYRSFDDMSVQVAFVKKNGAFKIGAVNFIYLKPHRIKGINDIFSQKFKKTEKKLLMLSLDLGR